MKRTLGFFGWTMLAALALALGIVIAVAAASMAGSLDPATIRIDAATLILDAVDVGDWLVAAGGVALALLIVAVVVPLALLIPLALAAVALGGALLLVAGVLAMVFSPLIFAALAVWLMVRMLRRSDAEKPAAGNARIAG